MAQAIGEKKADGVEVRFVGNFTYLLVTQENDMLPQKLDTIILVNSASVKALIEKLQKGLETFEKVGK